jgi:hypothetical protein
MRGRPDYTSWLLVVTQSGEVEACVLEPNFSDAPSPLCPEP